MRRVRRLALCMLWSASATAALAQPLPQPSVETTAVQATANGSTTVTTSTSSGDEGRRQEPKSQRTVVEDGRARIDELRVRGQLQRVTVSPKAAPSYDIVVVDGSRDVSDAVSPARGAAGKRVWNVLRF